MAAVTIKRIDQYLELQAERKELNRKARLIESQMSSMMSDFRAAIDKNKGKPLAKGNYVLSLQTKAGRVSWKDAYISVAGIKQAEKLTQAAEPVEYVQIS